MTVSIIVPVYNASRFIGPCIESLQRQTHSEIEIILVDDGSTDASLAICKEYAEKDSRLCVLHQENSGASAARNKGIQVAKGGNLMFVDADDFVDKNIVKILLDGFQNADEVGLSICLYKTHFFSGGKSCSSGFSHSKDGVFSVERYMDFNSFDPSNTSEVCEKAFVSGNIWARMYLASIIKENGLLFDASLSRYEDVLFNLSYLKFARSIYLNKKALYNYSVYADHASLSEKIAPNKFMMISNSYHQISKLYEGKTLPYIKYYYSYLIIGHIIRLFQENSPYSFGESLSETKKVCESSIYKEVMLYYRIPKGASKLIPALLDRKLYLLASIVAWMRMMKCKICKKPIRQWCFNPEDNNKT
jgi:glycosyltransferase involved in cell wall biosynthesis